MALDQDTVLIVDDDPLILKSLTHRLRKEGYPVITASNGEEALDKFWTYSPCLVVLDLMLPRMDGFDVCSRIRQSSGTPIIVLSARADERDKVLSFNLGADDYVTKPFSMSELCLRVKAVLRRARDAAGRPSDEREVFSYPGITIDKARCFVEVEGRQVSLTPKEFALMWLLVTSPGRVFTREQILSHVWGSDAPKDSENVTVAVSRLRDKVEPDPQKPKYIRTVWGIGYKFEP